MYEIALIGLEFHAYHGVYDYEKASGNHFLIDIKVWADSSLLETAGDEIQNVVDYTSLYKIAADVMGHPVNLLETVAMQIIRSVMELSSRIESVEVCVSKLQPPLGGKCQASRVTIRQDRTN